MIRAAPSGRKLTLWLLIAAGLMVLVGANAHLVYVAMSSQPDCVTHTRIGDTADASGRFSAARSACTSR